MELYFRILLKILPVLSIISLSIREARSQECVSSHHNQYDSCTTEVFQNSRGWREFDSICNYTATAKGKICVGKQVCSRVFRLLVYSQQLFAVTMKNTVLDMLQQCCGKCMHCDVVKQLESDMDHASVPMMNSSDIVFPVIGEEGLQMRNKFHFLPAYDVPSSYYCMRKKSSNEIIREIVSSFLNMWSLLMICLLFALISGFFVWLAETHSNRDEFPRRFHVGLFDGFWWSFVAMTTVGFGDKVPRSFLGRLYAVFWILLGIVMFSMLTAALTSEIIAAREPADTDMAGKNVGVLNGRVHDIGLVAQHGGLVKIGSTGHTMRGIAELISLLETNKIDGYLVDRNTYYHFLQRTKEEKYQYLNRKMGELNIIKTEKFRRSGRLMCGMLIKRKEDYLFFKTYFQNSQMYTQSCNDIRMNTKGTKMAASTDIFAYEGSILHYMMNFSLAVVGVLILVGLILEGLRYWQKRNGKIPVKEDELKMEALHLNS